MVLCKIGADYIQGTTLHGDIRDANVALWRYALFDA